MRARLLLAVIVFPAFTLTAQPHGNDAPIGASTAARAGSARLEKARARSASIDDKSFATTPANRSGAGMLERLRSAVSFGTLDTEARAAEEVRSLAGGFSPYPMPGGVALRVYSEPGEKVHPARRAIEKPDTPPTSQPTVNSGSGCWWLWVFTGVPFCS